MGDSEAPGTALSIVAVHQACTLFRIVVNAWPAHWGPSLLATLPLERPANPDPVGSTAGRTLPLS